jgi:hypothetical protein
MGESREKQTDEAAVKPAAESATRQARETAARPPKEAAGRPGAKDDPAAGRAGAEQPFEIGAWKGHTQWRCKLCPWDTLDGEEAMLAHVATCHTPQAPRPTVLVADRRGRPVER